jgi:hypothetical protein
VVPATSLTMDLSVPEDEKKRKDERKKMMRGRRR